MKVDFDEYADRYESLLKEQLSFFNGDRGYFSEYKIEILKRLFPQGFGSILDFGSGVGLTLPYVQKHFPASKISATDISVNSLAHISKKYPGVEIIPDGRLGGRKFDLILVFTVLHHIEPSLRAGVMSRLSSLLAANGRICIFEHNPWNPVTRHLVSTCPFDEDAILLSMSESTSLIRSNTELDISHHGYTLFFPRSLRWLSVVEPLMSWLPLGGQYYVVGSPRALE